MIDRLFEYLFKSKQKMQQSKIHHANCILHLHADFISCQTEKNKKKLGKISGKSKIFRKK